MEGCVISKKSKRSDGENSFNNLWLDYRYKKEENQED
jgi:hypothetical protein